MGDGEYVLVTEFPGMALNDLFCADVLRPLDLVPLTDFTYKCVLTTTSIIVSVKPANPGPPGKWLLKRERDRIASFIVCSLNANLLRTAELLR